MGVLDFLQPRINTAALTDDPFAAIKAQLAKYQLPDQAAPAAVRVDTLAPNGITPSQPLGPPPGVSLDTTPQSPVPIKKPGLLDTLFGDDSASGGMSRKDKLAMLGATLQDMGGGLGGEKPGAISALQKQMLGRQELADQKTLGSNLASAFQGGTVGGPATAGAPTPPGAIPTSAPGTTATKSASGPDVRAIYGTIAKGLALGKDMTPYLTLADKALPALSRQSWLETLPEEDRAAASQDPAGYLAWVRPKIEATSGPIQSVNPRTGVVSTLKEADPKDPEFGWQRDPANPSRLIPTQGGPADPAYINQTAKGRAAGAREGAPPQFVVYGPSWEHPTGGGAPTTTKVVGQVADKVRTQGVDALSPGEKAIWDRYVDGTKNNPVAALTALLSGDTAGIGGPAPGGAPTPPQPPSRPPAVAPAPAAPRPQLAQASAARVTSKADLDRLPKGAAYINPSDGRVLHKNY